METSILLLVFVALIMGSLWAGRRAQEPGPHAHRYRQLRLVLAFAGLAAALFAVWSTTQDHRRAREASATSAPADPR